MNDSVLLSPIDEAFGRVLFRHAHRASGNDSVSHIAARTAELVSAWRADGHSCLEISDALLHLLSTLDGEPPCASVDAWRAALLASGVCIDAADAASIESPLVLEGARLYLPRFRRAEQRLAAAIRARVAEPNVAKPDETKTDETLFAELFPPSNETDWQAVAARTALRSRLTFITGGPGTGKTTVAARILALLLHTYPTLRVALAAPTGRAAARLAEAIGLAATSLPAQLAARMPSKGVTLHRLLGHRPWDDRFTFGPAHPLAHDVIVVDEASMVDVLMMDALFAAVRSDARVIVLGDPDQLASVETGCVLGDIARAADRHGGALRDSVVRLRHSYRFDERAGIGQIASAIQRQDADAAMTVLRDESAADVSVRAEVPSTAALLEPIEPQVRAFLDTTTPADALSALAQFRVLCALREGDTGVSGLNARIERWLAARGYDVRGWYDHRPVLITSNDTSTGLFNGDVGVTLIIDGKASVWFHTADGPRAFAPSRLGAHETAWAMTVHKAQGSEFAHVLLVCPDSDNRLLTRELLYTATTRARHSLAIVGRDDIIRTAIGRTISRSSGLTERLHGIP